MIEMKLQTIVKESGLESEEGKTLLDKFGHYEEVAKEWEVKAKKIVVINASQTTEIEMAKVVRKKFSDLRIELEKSRKVLKEQSLRKGQAIDAIARFLQSLLKPIEEHLKLQENFVKIQEEKKAEKVRIEEEKRLAAEELARIKKQLVEQKEILEENEKLKREAAVRDKVELRKREQEQKKIDEERKKREKAEQKLRAEKELRDKKERKAKQEADKKLAEQKAQADKERLEKERIQKLLDEQIECPFCHKKFNKEKI